jgi:hypothetical protein
MMRIYQMSLFFTEVHFSFTMLIYLFLLTLRFESLKYDGTNQI